METFFYQCFIFTIFVLTNEIQGQNTLRGYFNTMSSKIYSKPNEDFLQCLPDLFDSLFTYPLEDVIGRPDSIIRTEKLYQSSQCIAQSIPSSGHLVHSFGELFSDIMKLKVLKQGCEKENKIKKIIYQNGIHIVNEIRKNQTIFFNLIRITGSFLAKMEPVEPSDPDDELSQHLSRNLLECLAYHFSGSFFFKNLKLPEAIKEQDKMLQRDFNWNSGFIAVTAERSKTMFVYIARMFKILFNFPQSNYTKRQQRKQMKYFYLTLADIMDELSNNISLNASVTGNRILYEFVEGIEEPEPNDPDVKITRATFSGVSVVIQEPTKPSSKLRPGLVHLHGGGWVYRKPEKYLPQTVYLAKNLNAVVISVDYRRSPEYKYPYPVQDCLKATKYFMKNAIKYNVDVNRVGIIGDSVGGNMAAVVSLMLRDDKLKKLKTQVLIYPAIQMFDLNLPSHQQVRMMFGIDHNAILIQFYLIYQNISLSYIDAISKNKHICDDMKNSVQSSYFDLNVIPGEYLTNYTRNESKCDPILAEIVKETMLNPYIFPMMAKDLNGLPPTLIINAEFDNLRDEGLMFGSRLRKAGTLIEEHLVKGGYHDMFNLLNFKKSEIGKEAMGILINYLKKNL